MAAGDGSAEHRVFDLLRQQLHAQARFFMRRQGKQHTLQTTALVNEVYLKLHGQRHTDWENRRHFLRVAAAAMRSILVDHARGKERLKRVPPGERVSLAHAGSYDASPLDLLALDEAMTRLGEVDELAAHVVECRWYLGLPMEEVAQVLRTSTRTAERKWRVARAFLYKELY